MSTQFIFAVETNKSCNSDWIYIKSTIEHFYEYEPSQVKLSVVYMDGKGNYNSAKKEREIRSLISQYKATSKNNRSAVIYCFDCDDYNSNPETVNFLEAVKKYCDTNDYEFVWFCRDVEEVYLGKSVENSKKKKEAAAFKIQKGITKMNVSSLTRTKYQRYTSNIINVLDQFKELKRKR